MYGFSDRLLLMVAIIGLFVRMNQLQEAALAALAAPPAGATMQDVGLAVGRPAPAFILPDVNGAPVALEDFAGRRVLLVFSSVSCPACTEMYPHLRAFSEAHRQVQVVMVSRGAAEENRALVEEQGFAFPVLTWEDSAAQAYAVPGTPFCYVVDEAGVIVGKGFANTRAQFEALVGGRAE
mgnify:CR=1 FL=1